MVVVWYRNVRVLVSCIKEKTHRRRRAAASKGKRHAHSPAVCACGTSQKALWRSDATWLSNTCNASTASSTSLSFSLWSCQCHCRLCPHVRAAARRRDPPTDRRRRRRDRRATAARVQWRDCSAAAAGVRREQLQHVLAHFEDHLLGQSLNPNNVIFNANWLTTGRTRVDCVVTHHN